MAIPIAQGRTPDPVPPIEHGYPPELGASYDKARRAYGSVSALLLAWELVGIELQPTPIENLKITLKSPQAAPYVLLVLVLYFAFRLSVEWCQAVPQRRQMRPSKVDFVIAHLIGTCAIGLFSVQRLLEIQIADRISVFPLGMFFFGLTCGAVVLTSRDAVDQGINAAIVVLGTVLFLGLNLIEPSIANLWTLLLGVAAGGIVRLIPTLKSRRRRIPVSTTGVADKAK